MPNDKLNSYITNRLINNLRAKYSAEITQGKSLKDIQKEILVYDKHIQIEVLKKLTIVTNHKSNNKNVNNTYSPNSTAQQIPKRRSISHIINSDLSNHELDDFDSILKRHKHIFDARPKINTNQNDQTNNHSNITTDKSKNREVNIKRKRNSSFWQRKKSKTNNNLENENTLKNTNDSKQKIIIATNNTVKNNYTGIKGVFTLIRQNPKFEFAIFMILILFISLLTLNTIDPLNKSNGTCPHVSDADMYRVSEFYWNDNNKITYNQIKDFIKAYYGEDDCIYIDSSDVRYLRKMYDKYYKNK